MEQLRLNDLRALNASTLLLHNDAQPETLPARVQASIAALMPAEVTAMECFDAEMAWTGRLFADPEAHVAGLFRAFLQERLNHPLFPLFAGGQLETPVQISDLLTLRALCNLPIYREFLQPLGVNRQMAVALKRSNRTASVLILGRWGREFTESERTLLAAFTPHLVRAMRIADFVGERRQSDLDGLRVGGQDAMTPAGLQTCLGITAREAEILWWLAQGKTDTQIAIICETAKRTVQKHCENLYRKLGVECRTAAVVRALEACPGVRCATT